MPAKQVRTPSASNETRVTATYGTHIHGRTSIVSRADASRRRALADRPALRGELGATFDCITRVDLVRTIIYSSMRR